MHDWFKSLNHEKWAITNGEILHSGGCSFLSIQPKMRLTITYGVNISISGGVRVEGSATNRATIFRLKQGYLFAK